MPNPFSFLYGTMGILVLSNIIHFYTVSFMTATTALKQLDAEFEAVSASLRVPFYRTFWRVTLPLCLPAILEITMYYFINAMVTVSALIFLYPPKHEGGVGGDRQHGRRRRYGGGGSHVGIADSRQRQRQAAVRSGCAPAQPADAAVADADS